MADAWHDGGPDGAPVWPADDPDAPREPGDAGPPEPVSDDATATAGADGPDGVGGGGVGGAGGAGDVGGTGRVGGRHRAPVASPRPGTRRRQRAGSSAGSRTGTRTAARRMVAPVLLATLVLVLPLSLRAALTVDGPTIGGRAVAASSVAAPTTPARPGVERVIALGGHPLLGAGTTLPATTCELPRFRRETNELRAYYHALVECLDASWHDVLVSRGMPHGSPSLNLAEQPGQTGCGNPADRETDFTALYCPSDLTLYLPVDRLRSVDGGAASSHLAIVAHEYAHHVQEMSGLLWAAAEEFDRVGVETDAGKLVSRRIELQANCFAGLFLGSVAGRGDVPRRLAEQAVSDFGNGGLHDTHGTAPNQAAWARRGFDQGTTIACDTWSAAPADVS